MRLHRLLLFAACSLALSSTFSVGQTKKSAEEAVRAADAAWMEVFSAKDLDKSVAFFADDGSMLSQNAPIAVGHEAIRTMLAQFFKLPNLKITWRADKASVARSGELGYTSGTYQMTITDPSGKTIPDVGKYVTVWKKQADGSWKVVLDIFNTDVPPPGGS